MTLPSPIASANITSQDTFIVQETAVLRLTFLSPIPLNAGCYITIAFPSDLVLSLTTFTTVTGMNLFGAQWVM